MDLLQELIARQRRLNESDQIFADRLGVSRSQWTKTRNRERTMADSVLAGVIRAFPDLEPIAWQYKRSQLGLPVTASALPSSPQS